VNNQIKSNRSSKRFLRTSDLARDVGCHPNTVRLYEEWGYLQPVPRHPHNNYRMFTPAHLDQMRLAWLALKYPYPGGKQIVLDLVHQAAHGNFGQAMEAAYAYLIQVQAERAQAEAAIVFVERWINGVPMEVRGKPLSIGQVAELIGLSRDTLRDWERNGLLTVPRNPYNNYRRYGSEEIGRLRVIRMLREAGYSLMAILGLMIELDRGKRENLRQIIDTPREDSDILFIADRWLSTLAEEEVRANAIINQLEKMMLALD
jgi:DNA-binding transcriptional MerR regulator